MKKLLSIVLSFTLLLGLYASVNTINADTFTINSTPTEGSTVNLLSGRVYDFCSNYYRGAVDTCYKKYGNDYLPTPLTISWDSVPDAKYYTVEIGTDPNLQNAQNEGTLNNTVTFDDLFTGCDYYYRVTGTTRWDTYSTGIINIKTADLPRTVRLDGIHNTRDFGGSYTTDCMHRVKQGVLYRGARLDEITSEAKTKMIFKYKIKTDFDLRESSKVPDTPPLGDDAKLINISSPQYLDKPDYTRQGVGYGISNPSNFPTLKNEFLVFADASNYPIYLHCNIGRDRTGTICALLGGLLGMYEEDIYRDYELSFFDNWCNGNLGNDTPDKWEQKRIGIMLDYIKEYYPADTLQGSVTRYMKEALTLTDEDINNIKSNLLEDLSEPVTTRQFPTTTVAPTTTETTVAPTAQPVTVKPTGKPTTKATRPGKAKIKKAKYKKKRKISLKLKKVSGAKGYHIRYSDSKKFDGYWDKYTKKLKYTLKKLDKHTKYYIKVRAYKKIPGGKLYGKWSKVKKVKVKK